MYLDGSTGIVIGLLLGVFGSAILWAILYHQVQQIRRRFPEAIEPPPLWIFQVPQQRQEPLAIAPYQPDADSAALLAQTGADQ